MGRSVRHLGTYAKMVPQNAVLGAITKEEEDRVAEQRERQLQDESRKVLARAVGEKYELSTTADDMAKARAKLLDTQKQQSKGTIARAHQFANSVNGATFAMNPDGRRPGK